VSWLPLLSFAISRQPRGLAVTAVGRVSLLDGEAFAIGALTLRNGRITSMEILLDPARLARLDLTAFDSPVRRFPGA
jgi:hypothetical protein